MAVHVVFNDRHCLPGVDLSYHDLIGKLIVDVRPDVVVDNGDGADMPSLCVSPETKILTATLEWKEAGSLFVGEEILGFDERPVGTHPAGTFRKFRVGVVTQNTRFVSKEGFRVVTTHGTVVCSKDHQFLSYNTNGAKKAFRSSDKIQVGWKICSLSSAFHLFSVTHPLTKQEIGYLQGFLDGEGYYGDGRLSWSQNDGPVANYVKTLVEKLGFNVQFYEEENRPKLKHYYIQGSYLNSWKLLHLVRPYRLLSSLLSDIDNKSCSKFSGAEDATVLSVEELKNVEVIGLETTTKTYISNSLFSHNCSYDRGTRSFQGRNYQADVASANEGNDRIWSVVKKAKRKLPLRVTTIGNHERRIHRALELSPELDGAITIKDLNLDSYYDIVVDYDGATPGIISLDGVYYAHYLVSGIKGLPISGEHPAASLILKNGASCTVGHSHVLDYSRRVGVDGKVRNGLVSGWCGLHRPSFAGTSSNLWWSGVVIKRNVEDGNYDPEFVSMERLIKEYA